MLLPNFVRSSRLFLYLGFGLIFLALICLPAMVRVVVQPEVMEYSHMAYGLIFAPIIGLWGLTSLALGIAESIISKRVLAYLITLLCLVNGISALMIWGAYSASPVLLLTWLGFYYTPCIVANMTGLLYFTKREKLTKTLKNPKIRMLLIITFTTVPILIAGGVLYMWLATIFY